MRSAHTALLTFSETSLAARQSTVFPALGNRALLSIGQVCDDSFDVNFTSSDVRISKNDTLISGKPDSHDGLSSPPPTQSAHVYRALSLLRYTVYNTYTISIHMN